MTGSGRRFDPADLSNDPATLTEAEIVGATAIARDLEAIAERDDAPTVGFSDKVMAAIAAEPTPKPTRVFGAALRAGRFGTAVGAVGDAWRVAFGGGRPFAVRGQALALVLVVLIGVLGLGGGVTVGAARLLNSDVAPSPSPAPSVLPPSPSPAPSLEPSPAPSPSPTESAEPSRRRPNRPDPTTRAAILVQAVEVVPARTTPDPTTPDPTTRAPAATPDPTTRAPAATRGRAPTTRVRLGR